MEIKTQVEEKVNRQTLDRANYFYLPSHTSILISLYLRRTVIVSNYYSSNDFIFFVFRERHSDFCFFKLRKRLPTSSPNNVPYLKNSIKYFFKAKDTPKLNATSMNVTKIQDPYLFSQCTVISKMIIMVCAPVVHRFIKENINSRVTWIITRLLNFIRTVLHSSVLLL